MSNPRVTDVQAALRRFRNLGHDVLEDPRAVHVEGQRYGMAAGHILTLSDVHSYKALSSKLQQSERPMLSIVHSSIDAHPNDIDEISRSVVRATPLIHPVQPGNDANRPLELMHSYSQQQDNEPGAFMETSKAPTGTTMFEKVAGGPHKDIHEALRAHTTEETSHVGQVRGSRPIKTREMTQDDRFDHQSALLAELHPVKPHSGLIYVSHYSPVNGWTDHSYNPETEQLLKTDTQRSLGAQ
jgi:hypothetical protein